MTTEKLRVTLGQHSRAGVKGVNQDFHGAMLPGEPLLSAKGIVVALADGIGSSPVSHIATDTKPRINATTTPRFRCALSSRARIASYRPTSLIP